MALEIKNYTPLCLRYTVSITNIQEILGWREPEETAYDASGNKWSWYDIGDNVDFRTIKSYLLANPGAIRVYIFFDSAKYLRYANLTGSVLFPDYFPRNIINHIEIESVSQSKSIDEREVE